MSVIDQGRADLAAWLDDQPKNFYLADPCLRALHGATWTDAERDRFAPALAAYGEACAGPLDAAARTNNQHRNLPALDPYDGVGQRRGPVEHHPSYHDAGRIIYGSGVMSAYGERPAPHRYILSLFYLSSHVGEGGHNCPLACTAGAIRALQELGTPAQQERFLPGLLNPDWDRNFTGAQFLTEVQGGSDVGANGTVAALQPDGSYRITGEKWFCSNIDAEVILMTARIEDGPAGTRGLGLFLVPAWLPDGRANDFRARRLKDKLGTRSMASAEVDFLGAWAEAIGPVEVGFRNMMQLVINTSRLYNAFSVAGMAHRACLVAEGYARHRRAFGAPVARYPLVQETLAHMLADAEASLAGSWLLAGLQERLDRGEAGEDEQAFFRVALNVNKLRTAVLAHSIINSGIEVLGGNGAIESFSVLPRLLRDNVVCENWEGTHNTLRLQTLRDCKKMGIHHGFFRYLAPVLGEARTAPVAAALEQALAAPPELATLLMRPIADKLATLVHLAGLAPVDNEKTKLRARLTEDRHLNGGVTVNREYLEMIQACWSAM
jgi:acyl-CoA dehydrogenase